MSEQPVQNKKIFCPDICRNPSASGIHPDHTPFFSLLDFSVHSQVMDVKLGMFYRLADLIESPAFYCPHFTFVSQTLMFRLCSRHVRALHHSAASVAVWFGCSHPCHHLWWPADMRLPSRPVLRILLATVVLIRSRSRYRMDMWCRELRWPCSSPSARILARPFASDTQVPAFALARRDSRGVCQSDRLASGPMRCKIHEMQPVWWFSPV